MADMTLTLAAPLFPVSQAASVERRHDPRRLLEHFLSGRSAATRLAYRADMEAFASFLGAPSPEAAAQRLIEAGPGQANGLVLEYRAAMLERGFAPATINRRLAALRSVVKLARVLGFVSFEVEVAGVKSRAYRDSKGPAAPSVRDILSRLRKSSSPRGRRDYAVVRLLYDLALRRNEVVSLSLGDVDLGSGTVSVLGKGRLERELRTLPEPTKAALRGWLEVRGSSPGPLFSNFDRARKGSGLTGRSLHRIVRDLGLDAGITLRPHGLRHAAITAALDLTKGDIRAVARFSRHQDIRTVAVYDDNRSDEAGRIAALVAQAAEE